MITRVVRKCGNSRMVSIPADVQKKLNLKIGKHVVVITERNGDVRIYEIGDVELAFKEKKENSRMVEITVRKLVRQSRQMLVSMPVGAYMEERLRVGEIVKVEIVKGNSVKVSRLMK